MEQFEGYKIREVHDIDKWWGTGNNLIISRNGKSCVHSYWGAKYPNQTEWKRNVLVSFFAEAFKGSGDKETFMRERKGWSDAAYLWKNFKRSFDGLKRLDPDGYLEAIEIGRKELELIGK